MEYILNSVITTVAVDILIVFTVISIVRRLTCRVRSITIYDCIGLILSGALYVLIMFIVVTIGGSLFALYAMLINTARYIRSTTLDVISNEPTLIIDRPIITDDTISVRFRPCISISPNLRSWLTTTIDAELRDTSDTWRFGYSYITEHNDTNGQYLVFHCDLFDKEEVSNMETLYEDIHSIIDEVVRGM